MYDVIIDTGPLVALLDDSEKNHHWAVARFEEMRPPALLCEPVLVETMYLLGRSDLAKDALLRLLENGALRVAFRVDGNIPAIRRLHHKYRDQPISLADACIILMSEQNDGHSIITFDSDFLVYRKHGRQPLPLVSPPR